MSIWRPHYMTAPAGGVLNITDGALHARVTLFGQFTAAGFYLAKDSAGGTTVIHRSFPIIER
jgi:hypothetical protein